jgi:hypothetical protein
MKIPGFIAETLLYKPDEQYHFARTVNQANGFIHPTQQSDKEIKFYSPDLPTRWPEHVEELYVGLAELRGVILPVCGRPTMNV